MATLKSMAEDHGFQPYELAAYLGLGIIDDDNTEIAAGDEAEYLKIIAAGGND